MSSIDIAFLMRLVALVFAVCVVVAIFGRVAQRAGYPRWWGFVMLMPMLNLLVLWIFAFAIWPVMKPRGQAYIDRRP